MATYGMAMGSRAGQLLHSVGDILSLVVASAIAPLPMRTWPAVTGAAGRLSPARGRRHRRLAPWESAWFAGHPIERGVWAAAASLRVRAVAVRGMSRLPLPTIPLQDSAALREALADGQGALVWVVPTRMSDLLSKKALADAGIRAVHLSRTRHGAWRSTVGQRLNRWVRAAEDRYLGGRVMIADGNEPSGLRQLVRALKAGACVTIRLGDGASTAHRLPFLGGSIRVPDGPVRIARAAGSPLFAMVVLPTGPGQWTAVVDGPIPTGGDPAEALDELVRLIRAYVERDPEPFIGMLPAR